MHPCIHARTRPDQSAFIMADTGESVSFRELDNRSNQGAQLFRANGLNKGAVVAILAVNSARYLEIAWAAQRSGVYYTCISSRLTAPEIAYILKDSGAEALIASAELGAAAREAASLAHINLRWSIDGAIDDFEALETLRAQMPDTPIADESAGADMLYSSGTTGRPKGIRPVLDPQAPISNDNPLRKLIADTAGLSAGEVYLSPAPLYHAAPLRTCMNAHRIGATVIVMRRFDPERFLDLVSRYRVNHVLMVPTMFVRLLKLPDTVRLAYDVSSLRSVIHAAAPCPAAIKDGMLDWLGPIVHEFYAGSEANGVTWLIPNEWPAHRGSVGRAVIGEVHICNEEGDSLPPGEEGLIYFSGLNPPIYHNDPDKTRQARHPTHLHWSTLGDIGRLDADGYLYLTDRKAFMIISGGVNIYPQETEDILISHPEVADCAVFGVPNEDFGEEVKAVVQLMDTNAGSPQMADELIAYCRARLSPIKCPRSVDFEQELPRHATGKLYKRLIRDQYWGKQDLRIIQT